MVMTPLAACTTTEEPLPMSEAGLHQVRLEIASGQKVHKFIVEVALSDSEQSYGMMNRESLAPDRGMLFPYDPPRAVAFWMHNTLISLDLVFISPGGEIERIAADAVPYSLDLIPSDGAVEAVLELAGGQARQLGLKRGDKVTWERSSLPPEAKGS